MIVLNHAPHGHAIAAAMGSIFNPLGETVIARVERGKLLGGVLYDAATGTSVCMHTSGFAPHWLNRMLLWTVFAYPFNQLGCIKVIARIPSTNLKSLALALHLGFTEEARILDAVPNGHLLILTMRRSECRWLKLKPHGVLLDEQKLGPRAA